MKQESGLTKKVYVPMAADLLHEGHLNIINEAKKPLVPVNGAIVVCRLAVYGQCFVRKEPDRNCGCPHMQSCTH